MFISRFRKPLSALLFGVFMVSPSVAMAKGVDIGAIIRGVTQGVVDYISGGFTITLRQMLSTATQGIQGEISKNGVAQTKTAEAIATYQAKEQFRRDAIQVNEALEQPATTCQSANTANALPGSEMNVKANASRSNRRLVVSPIANNTDTTRGVLANYEKTMSNFCSDDDRKRGRCSKTADPDLQAGDMRAEMLFGDGNGSDTRPPKLDLAADAFVSRITNSSMGPEVLRDPKLEQTPQGRHYVEMHRQYTAFMSLVGFSLKSIQANHAAQPGLGNQTLTSQYTGKADISMSEAVGAFVKAKFSTGAIKDLATATQPTKILREIAVTDAFRAWVDYQSLLAAERIEALTAAQLSLATRQSLLPAVEAARASSARNPGGKG